jgi:hypothetical protein
MSFYAWLSGNKNLETSEWHVFMTKLIVSAVKDLQKETYYFSLASFSEHFKIYPLEYIWLKC